MDSFWINPHDYEEEHESKDRVLFIALDTHHVPFFDP